MTYCKLKIKGSIGVNLELDSERLMVSCLSYFVIDSFIDVLNIKLFSNLKVVVIDGHVFFYWCLNSKLVSASMPVYWCIQINFLQALKSAFHNYPNIVTACWEQVSAIVYHFISTACVEAPSRQSSEHVGSPTTFINEKVTIAAIKVATFLFPELILIPFLLDLLV